MDSSDSETSFQSRRFKCNIPGCSSSFSKNRKLIVHIRKHTGERPFKCDEDGCGKTYTNSSHLRRHKNVSHSEKTENEKIQCDHEGCGAVLANKYSLKRHCMRKHNSERYHFKCAECLQGFERKKQLQHHMYLHTGEAMFSCDKCEKKFTTSYLLNKHKRNHCDYYCDCGELFYQWSLLLAHRRLCHREKNTCDVCGKVFAKKENLKSHKLTHLDDSQKKVFICGHTDCKRFFFYKRNLKWHIQNFHMKINESKKYKCTYPRCQIVLKTKQSLRQHLERHFQWKIKKKRATRCDKGKPKKSITSLLVVADTVRQSDHLTTTDNSDKKSSPEEDIFVNHMREEDDPILKECEVVLQLLNEKLVGAA